MKSWRRMASHAPMVVLLAVLQCSTAARIAQRSKSHGPVEQRHLAPVPQSLENVARTQEQAKSKQTIPMPTQSTSLAETQTKRRRDKELQSNASLSAAEQQHLHTLLRFYASLDDSVFMPVNKQSMIAICGGGLLLVICIWCCLMGKSNTDEIAYKQSPLFEELPGKRNVHVHDGKVIYEWDQNDAMASLYIKVPQGLTKNDLSIKISPSNLQVGRKGKPPFLKEEFYDDVNEKDSSWELHGRCCQINLQKVNMEEWPYILLHKRETSQRWKPSWPSSFTFSSRLGGDVSQ